ncbi:hypothetical protein EPI10_002064 [Gossypium australe]|uniref:Uncharacterized protein n=1 Tax=Gossypium australe TaxID=47621 RepID=A0A5B6VCT1_9ROSI|nr:hypothetical protein EPI10_002064 [Gossypium australe]
MALMLTAWVLREDFRWDGSKGVTFNYEVSPHLTLIIGRRKKLEIYGFLWITEEKSYEGFLASAKTREGGNGEKSNGGVSSSSS